MNELDTVTVELPVQAPDRPKRTWVRKEIVSLYGTGYQPTLHEMIPDDADGWRPEDDIHEDEEVTSAGISVLLSGKDNPSEEPTAFETAYRQKILARKCLNMLVDIRSGLIRQNRFLELLISELKASGADKTQS